MVQAVGSAGVATGSDGGASTGVLEAQLNRYQIQLSDWCNCPSGKTPEGKAKIQQIQDQTDAVKAQLDRLAAAKARQSSVSDQVTVIPVSSAPPGVAERVTPSATRATTLGSFLDTFA